MAVRHMEVVGAEVLQEYILCCSTGGPTYEMAMRHMEVVGAEVLQEYILCQEKRQTKP